jgi:uncharacterized repeat protein (TIGR01451 family)
MRLLLRSQPRPRRYLVAAGLLFTLALLAALLPVSPARAAPILRLAVELAPGTTSPVPSGVPYRYRVTYECSSSSAGDICENMVVTSQLSPNLEFVQVSGNADIMSSGYSPATGLATWVFKSPLPLGTTGQFEFELRYKPGSTLDGESGTVTSTIGAGGVTVTPPGVTTPPADATDQSSVTKTLVAGGAAGGLSTYEIRVCAGSSGALDFTDLSVVDTLPAGAELVSTSPPHTSFAGGVLTWANAGDVVVPGCRSFAVTVRYSGPGNAVGAPKVNGAAVTGTPAGGVEKTITADAAHTLDDPAPALALEKSADADTIVGGTVTTRLRAANTGNVQLADVVVEDPIPAAQNVVSFTRGGALAVAYQKNGDAAWLAVPGPLPATIVAADLPGFAAGDYISRLRFNLGTLDEAGTPAPARVADTVTISATVINPPHAGPAYTLPSTVTNTASASASWAGGVLSNVTDGASTLVDVPKARPTPQKSIVSGSPALPGQDVRYRLSMANGSFAPLAEPVFGDLLPAELAFKDSAAPTVAGIPGCASAPAFSSADNFAGSGRTLLTWSYAGTGCAIPSGGAVVVEFVATVRNTTYPAAAIPNRLALLDFSTPTSLVRRANCAAAPDEQAILATAYDPARLCFSPAAPLRVNAAASIASAKQVRGQLDAQFHRDPRVGATVRGGLITYSVALTNTGNVDFGGLEVVDVLPYYDAGPPAEQNLGVRDLAALGTRWTPRLTGPVEISPPIPGLQVRYSAELNPCRPSLAPVNPGCTPMVDGVAPGPGVWSTELPSDPTAVRSLKFIFPADYLLKAAATVRFTFAMYAPEDAPLAASGPNGKLGDNDDLNVAWNTFGYQAVRADDGTRLVAQPPRVGIEVVPVPTGLATYGNYVWNDVDNQGDQDEPPALGINGVTVRLYRRAGGVDELVGTQITRDDAAGRPGFYLFPALQPGDYFAQIVPPAGFALTTPDAALPGDAADSDADPATGRTAVTTLSPDETDPGWDAGVYAPVVSLGSRVWYDADNDGRDDDGAGAAPGSSAGVPGVTVQLFLDENGDGSLTGRERVAIAEDVTGATGRYEFRQRTRDNTTLPPADLSAAPQPLYPGQYIVGVPAANFAAGGPLAGYHSSGTALGAAGAIGELPAPDPDSGADPADPADDDRDYDDNGDTVRDSARFYHRGVLGKPVFVGAGEPAGEPEPRGDAPADPAIPVPDDRSNFTVDFGFYSAGLGDRVWVDDGAGGAQAVDGVRTAGESGLAGVRVRLFDAANTTEIPVGADGALGTADDAAGGALTAAGGAYSFTGLPQGSYRVRVELPDGYASTRDTAGTATPDGDLDDDDNVVGIGTGLVVTPPLTIPAGVVTPAKGLAYDPTLDVGVVRYYSLGNRVWVDLDNDGRVDAGEPNPPADVTVRLLRGDGLTPAADIAGSPIPDATTANGYYRFDNLPAGDYVVELMAANFAPGGALDGLRSSSGAAGAYEPGPDPDADAADDDDNGTYDANGTPAARADDSVRSAPVTLGEGTGVEEPAADADGGAVAAPEAPDSQSNRSVDFGLYPIYSIGNRVWDDRNNDGVFSAGESGIDGVPVRLYADADDDGAADGAAIATRATSGGGYYLFTDLAAGRYIVELAAPAGYKSSTGLAGAYEPAPDPDASAADGDDNGAYSAGLSVIRSATLTLSLYGEPTGEPAVAGSADNARDSNGNLTVDFGLFRPLSLGNRVWIDADNSGVVDGAEAGVAGVSVSLFRDTNNDNAPDGAAIAAQTTAAGGYYLFTGLGEGTYIVGVDSANFTGAGALVGYTSSGGVAGAKEPAPDADTNPADDDDNGAQTGAPGQARSRGVTLTAGGEPTGEPATPGLADVDPQAGATPDSSANYTLDFGFVRKYSLGNRVWVDLNNNGRFDTGEPNPPANVTVRLLRGDGVTAATTIAGASVANATTANGYYRFDNLPAGDYVVELANSNFSSAGAALYGYRSSSGAAGAYEPGPDPDAGAADNDDNGTYNTSGTPAVFTDDVIRSAPVTLGEGTGVEEPAGGADADGGAIAAAEAPDAQSNRSVDFGLYPLYSIGNRVWDDRNNDGLLNAGESGIDGAVVNLYRAADLSTPLATVTTASGGHYLFTGLVDATDYVVELPASNFAAGGPLAGFTSSTGNRSAGVDPFEPAPDPDANTADGDDNGTAAGGIRAPAVTISYLGEPTTEAATAGFVDQARNSNGNLAVDFGLYQPLSLGNRVWNDRDDDGRVGAGEPGIDGVGVRLFRDDDATPGTPDGPAIRSVTTAGGGYYLFSGLGQGDYIVEVDAPAAMTSSTGLIPPFAYEPAPDPDASAADGDDDGTLAGAVARSAPVTLAAGGEPLAEGDVPAPADNTPDGSANLTVDFGFYAPLSLGNLVWRDADNDGVVSPGDGPAPGIAGRAVRLYQDSDDDGEPDDLGGDGAISPADAVRSTATSATGHYLFTGLGAGTYIVEVALQPGERSSTGAPPALAYEPPADADASPIDSDDNGADGDMVARSRGVTLAAGGEPTGEPATPGIADSSADSSANYSVDFGLFTTVSLGDLVFEDAANDGASSAPDDTPLPGAAVRLYAADGATPAVDALGKPVAEQMTGADGRYRFDNLRPGRYIVEVVAPAGYRSSTDIASSADPDGDVNGDDNGVGGLGTARSGPVALAVGGEPADDGDTDTSTNLGVDFGFVRLVSLGDLVFEDVDDDGLFDGADRPLPGAQVTLLQADGATPAVDADGAAVAPLTTAADGRYRFDGLKPGSYVVRVAAPAGYRSSTDRAETPFPDGDTDGDDNGPGGDGTVAGGVITLRAGGEPVSDGDADASSNLSLDFGFYRPVSLGDLVFEDRANDGGFDGADAPLAGARVELLAADGATPARDAAGAAVAPQTTGADGRYRFDGLKPGRYVVRVAEPAGYRSSTDIASSADPDNDRDADDNGVDGPGALRSGPVTLTSGGEPTDDGDGDATSNLSVDFGLYRPASIGDRVWLDGDGDGVQGAGEPGVPGVGVTLLQPGPDGTGGTADDVTVAATTTGPDGDYRFELLGAGDYFVGFGLPLGFQRSPAGQGGDPAADGDADPATGRTAVTTLAPGEHDPTWDAGISYAAGLGNRVWLDRDADGVQGAGEPGVPGVGVTLLDGEGLSLARTTTDEAGLYAFPRLSPGDYSVRFAPPDGFRFSPAGQGGNADADSDADPATGETPGTTLDPSEADPTWDAGLYTPVRLGNLVWDDVDDDGRLGADERGIPGVAVRLFADADADGAPDGAALATTAADEAGRYGFAGLTPGRYLVEVAAPAGYRSSTGTPGAATGPHEPAPNPDGDLDSDDDGTAAGAGSVRSGTVTLWSQAEPTADGDDADGNQSVDFGLFRPAALGSTVWLDSDGDGRQGSGERGVPGVLVSLYRSDGTPLRDGAGRPITATTDAAGAYLFDNLTPGSYQVRFSNLPDGYAFTRPGVGNDDGDSDADPHTGLTQSVTLTAGETNLTLWAGLVISPTAVTLTGFSAERGQGGVVLRWTTGAELNSVGFHILRSAAGERAGAERVTAELILARGGPQQGAAYAWVDRGAAPGVRYTYWLEELERGGGRNEYGPVVAAGSLKDGPGRIYLPLLVR